MARLLLTILNDDGTVAQRCGAPLLAPQEVAIRVYPGTTTVRMVYVADDAEGRTLIAEGELLDLLGRGGQTINRKQLANRLRIIADRLDSEVL